MSFLFPKPEELLKLGIANQKLVVNGLLETYDDAISKEIHTEI
jgi:arsenite-transporting ATPase